LLCWGAGGVSARIFLVLKALLLRKYILVFVAEPPRLFQLKCLSHAFKGNDALKSE
jgi:hypothetical protein